MQSAVAGQKPRTRQILKAPAMQDIARCVALFVAARASVLGLFPFGVACFAALLHMETAYLGLLAVGLAVFSAGGNPMGYVLSCTLFWVYAELRLRDKNQLVTMAVCSLCVFAGGLYRALSGGNSLYAVTMLVAESMLSGLLFYIFRRTDRFFTLCRTKPSQEDLVCGVVVLGVMLMGVSGLPLPYGMNPAMILGIVLVALVALHTGIAAAGCFGLTVGFICSMNRPEAIFLAGVFGLGAVFASLLRGFGRLGTMLGFLMSITVALFYVGNIRTMPITLGEILVACLLFAVIPKPLQQRIGVGISIVLEGRHRRADRRMKKYLSGELRSFAKAFGELADNFLTVEAHREDIYAQNVTALIDTVIERTCGGCRRWGECWHKKAEQTYQQAYMIYDVMERQGYCDMENLPIVFKNSCIRAEEFVTTFNHVYELDKQNVVWQGEASMGQSLVARQYNEISNIMRGLSYAVEDGFCFVEESERKIADKLLGAGILVKEVSVIENVRGAYVVEVVPGLEEPVQAEVAASAVLGIPMQTVVSDEDRTKLVAAGQFRVEISVRQQTKDGEAVSGDTVQYFQTEENKFYALLCDGMGSGSKAGSQSRRTAALLADFLRAGINKETAVNMINSTLALKTGQESFTTVDLAEVDLCTGEVTFLKVGGGPGYVRYKDQTETVEARSLPIGILEEARPVIVRRTLGHGDIAVLASDGISEAGHGAIRGEWIKKTMRGEYTMAQLADRILDNAIGKTYPKPTDDMTVICIKLWRI